ncbi:MAG: BON domain-containing protein [Burkholderiales bacterium]
MKTDSQLQQDVMEELKWELAVHAAQIGVEVRDGVVTLAGEVSSYCEKLNVERDLTKRPAWGSSGVRNVVDQMELA